MLDNYTEFSRICLTLVTSSRCWSSGFWIRIWWNSVGLVELEWELVTPSCEASGGGRLDEGEERTSVNLVAGAKVTVFPMVERDVGEGDGVAGGECDFGDGDDVSGEVCGVCGEHDFCDGDWVTLKPLSKEEISWSQPATSVENETWIGERYALVVVGGKHAAAFKFQNMIHQGTVWGLWLWNVFYEDATAALHKHERLEVVSADDLNAFRDFDLDTPNMILAAEAHKCQE